MIIIEQVIDNSCLFFFFWLHSVLVASCGTFFLFFVLLCEIFPWRHMGSVAESLVGLVSAKLMGY